MEFHILKFCVFWSANLHVMTTLFLLTHLLQSNTVANASSNETDRLALLKFKDSIVSDPQGSLNSWNESIHFCNWRGISCGRRHQRVTTLNLQHSDLHGTISPYIGNLSFLRVFSLYNNSFSGMIPQQVDQLFRLQYLNLRANMLEGGIPLNLTFCPKLSIIDFDSNRLTGVVPSEIGSLMKLEVLQLSRNNLTGGIPPSFGNLSSLTKLSLSVNQLGGNVPEELGRMRSLSHIAIGGNNLSGTLPPSLFNISSMTLFSFPVNNLKGSIPPSIGLNMPNLRRVELAGNKLSGQIPASFSNASQLRLIDLGNNDFVGQVPASFGNLLHLEILSVTNNRLGSNSTDDLGFITSLTNSTNLKIDVSRNNFGGVLANSVGNFSANITQLYLGSNQLVGTIPETLGNVNSLILLTMEDNLFTGNIPSSLGKLQNLQILALNTNRLSGSIPSSLGNLTQLFELDLFENKFEGSIPPTISYCKNLQILDISLNRLSGDVPSEITGLTSLLVLNLSQNSLIGSLPVEVNKLENIYYLDISGNNLTGEIPETIGECKDLEFLSLRGNLIQGTIPSSLASVRGLQYLDLSQNNLSGEIPKELQGLSFLIYLNFSSNNLKGEVPKEGVFRSSSGISLDGNAKLCGGVSELRLPTCPIIVPKKTKLNGFKLKLIISVLVGCSALFALMSVLYWRKKTQKKKPVSEVAPINSLSKVSYQTLHQATGGFSLSNQIGSGGFSSVYKAILHEQEDDVVAIKVLNLRQKGASKTFVAECNALRNIRHRNLVKIITCCSSTDHNGNDFKALVFEYMSNGSLEEWLHMENQSRSLKLLQRLNVAFDVASAMCYLHDHCEPQIIHRDLKPSNVLLDDDMVARVSDFGLARLIQPTTDSYKNQSSTAGIKGTIGYAAPEYAVGVEPSTQGDVYSYGILVLELFTGRKPTDEMFVDGCNIRTFVKMGIQGTLMQIVDPALVATLEETTIATTNNEVTRIHGSNNEIEADGDNVDNPNLSRMNTDVGKCILPVLKIGLACSEEMPRNRMSMEEVLKELHHLKNAYAAIGVFNRRERPRRS